MGLVSGYLASLSVAGTAIEPFTSSATRSATRATADKTKLGSDRVQLVATLGDATIDAQLHADTTVASALEAAYEATAPIVVVFRPGALGVADLGSYQHDGVIVDMSYTGDADGEWDLSLSIACTGQYVYTEPAA